jgi:hypothetical protein
MQYNQDKLLKLINTAKYVSTTHKDLRFSFDPVWTEYTDNEYLIAWGKQEMSYKTTTLQQFCDEFYLPSNNCEFIALYSSQCVRSMMFYSEAPIEIPRLFDTTEDIIKLFLNHSITDIVVLKQYYYSYGKSEFKLKFINDLLDISQKTMQLYNILIEEENSTMDFEKIFNNQTHVKNNTIYLLGNTWIKFYLLTPINFQEIK